MDSVCFQDGLGETLLALFVRIPEGALVFFPSYSLLDKLITRWKTTGLWDSFSATKRVVVEPRYDVTILIAFLSNACCRNAGDDFLDTMKEFK